MRVHQGLVLLGGVLFERGGGITSGRSEVGALRERRWCASWSAVCCAALGSGGRGTVAGGSLFGRCPPRSDSVRPTEFAAAAARRVNDWWWLSTPGTQRRFEKD